MKEKTLLKIALIISIIGTVILFAISEKIEIAEKDTDYLNKADTNEKIKVKGRVNNIIKSDKAVIMEIAQPITVNAIIFKENNTDIKVNNSDYVEIIGSVQDYKGRKEIIVDRLRIIR